MKINEIKRGMNAIDIKGKITEKSIAKRVRTRYGPRRVCNATIEDETGYMVLTLWENSVNKVNVGDKVKISGAYVTEFRDILHLNVPSSGKLEVTKEDRSI